MALFLALLVGGAEADDGLAADQGRAIAVGAGHFDGGADFVRVVAVDVGHHVPAVAFETLGGVVGEPAVDFAVDGDAVVIVEHDQLAQPQSTGQGADFVGNTFHHAAIAHEYVGIVIDDVVAAFIEVGCQGLFRNRHAHRIGDALSQRAGGGFHARGVAVFRMAWGLGVQLAEILQIVDGNVIAGQVQQ